MIYINCGVNRYLALGFQIIIKFVTKKSTFIVIVHIKKNSLDAKKIHGALETKINSLYEYNPNWECRSILPVSL